MDDIIKIKNLYFEYKEKVLFEHFDLCIKRNSFTSIVGPNGSGKSTLIKILNSLEKFSGHIMIDGVNFDSGNKEYIKNKIGIVFDISQYVFKQATVGDELSFILKKLDYSVDEKEVLVNKVSELLKIRHLIDDNPNNLNDSAKQMVALACTLVKNPKILIIDDTLNMIDNKEKLFRKLRKLIDLTIINITYDLNECLFGDRVVVIDNGKVVLQGKSKVILQEEKLLNGIGLKVPFMVDLSIKLKFYNLISEVIFDVNKMVNKLWK
ncbi:MAG: ATP-binding cassette domain-containing protein [Bacilli bacterium]